MEELIGEVIVGIVEIGAESASESSNKKDGCGCFIAVVIVAVIITIAYFLLKIAP